MKFIIVNCSSLQSLIGFGFSERKTADGFLGGDSKEMKSEDSNCAWKYLVDEDVDFVCGYCGKVIESPGKAFALVLEIVNEDFCSGEGILWNSDPYCSEECFMKVAGVIVNDLRAKLFERDFAKNLGVRDGFKTE